jgi:hypothetical protein
MTPEQRLKRVERILGRLATRGRKARSDFRDKINILIDAQIRSEETFREKINILTDAQSRNEEAWLQHKEAWRAESHAVNEQIKATDEQIKNVALAQIDLTKSQKLTDRALRDFINSLRKNRNGK